MYLSPTHKSPVFAGFFGLWRLGRPGERSALVRRLVKASHMWCAGWICSCAAEMKACWWLLGRHLRQRGWVLGEEGGQNTQSLLLIALP